MEYHQISEILPLWFPLSGITFDSYISRINMAEFKFYLKELTAKKETPIILFCHWNKQQLKFYPGMMALPADWNKKEGRFRQTKDNVRHKALNNTLKDIEQMADNTYSDLEAKLKRIPSKEEFREALAVSMGKRTGNIDAAHTANIFDYTMKECDKMKNEQMASGKAVGGTTIVTSYKQTANLLLEFHKGKKEALRFDLINLDWYNEFILFCTEVKDYKPNNIGKHIKNIKAIMNRAMLEELHSNGSFRRFYKPTEEVNPIYLTPGEIEAIQNLQFGEATRYLESSRDLFVIGCWTGLRFSDWKQFAKSDIKDDFITIKPKKTEKPVVIPVHPIVRQIAAKYDWKLPEPKENQTLNRDLKEIARLAGIAAEIEQHITKGGRRSTQHVPKYELVTTHTARRSFATNLYNMGVPSIDIMHITGHRTEKSFLKYIRITANEAAKRILSIFKS
jgi:integrase